MYFTLPIILVLAFLPIYLNHGEALQTVSIGIPNKAIFFQSALDVSVGAALTSDVFVVADDENNMLRFYNKSIASLPIKKADLDAFLQIDSDYPKADIETATRVDQV